jgi:hypothetical protein
LSGLERAPGCPAPERIVALRRRHVAERRAEHGALSARRMLLKAPAAASNPSPSRLRDARGARNRSAPCQAGRQFRRARTPAPRQPAGVSADALEQAISKRRQAAEERLLHPHDRGVQHLSILRAGPHLRPAAKRSVGTPGAPTSRWPTVTAWQSRGDPARRPVARPRRHGVHYAEVGLMVPPATRCSSQARLRNTRCDSLLSGLKNLGCLYRRLSQRIELRSHICLYKRVR